MSYSEWIANVQSGGGVWDGLAFSSLKGLEWWSIP